MSFNAANVGEHLVHLAEVGSQQLVSESLRLYADAFAPLLAPDALEHIAKSPAALTGALVAASSVACFVLQAATGYWSYVDRLWSVLPVVFVAVFPVSAALAGGPTSQRECAQAPCGLAHPCASFAPTPAPLPCALLLAPAASVY